MALEINEHELSPEEEKLIEGKVNAVLAMFFIGILLFSAAVRVGVLIYLTYFGN